MPLCEHCKKEFNTEEGLKQHQADKHGIGKVTSHEMKEKKKEERERKVETETGKIKSARRMRNTAIAAFVIILIAGVGYIVATLPPPEPPVTSVGSGNYNLAGFPNSFIHWHADVDVLICGEDVQLPYALNGGLLGTGRLHTHDYAQNIASLPGTDGNGVIHTEGNVPQAPAEHTLGKFMGNIGVRFSNTTIMDKTNGDLCGEAAGTVKVFLNDQPLSDPLNYLPRDRDEIRIEFS